MSVRSRSLVLGFIALVGILVLIGVLARPSPEQSMIVTWEPLAEPSREADTLFLPDFSSARTINSGGGFLSGDETEPQRELIDNFEFAAGKFGPAIRPKPGRADFVFYPVDGLLDGDEFTLEFWAKGPRPWSAIQTGKATLAVTGGVGGNRLQILSPYDRQCAIHLGSLETVPSRAYKETWQKPCDELGLTAGSWHHIAVTLKQRTMRIYIDGKQVGRIAGVRFLPLWSDTTNREGFQIGGEPGVSNNVWISDVRVSRTARIPGRPVRLRQLTGSMTVDSARVVGTVPRKFVGGLKVGGIGPMQAKSGLDVIREADTVTATPIKRGAPDKTHPSRGHSGRFAYDWQVVDRTFEWLEARGLEAYIGADSTPQLLGGSVPPRSDTPHFGGTWASEVPNDLDAWATVIGDLVHHVKQRGYVVSRWSVWNEPDLGSAFWKGTTEQYLDLYAATARAIKAADPKAKVGGPEIAHLDSTWIKDLFERARRDDLPLDFISFHDYSGDLNTLTRARALVDYHARRQGFPTPFPIAISEFNWSDRNEYGSGVAAFNTDFWHVRSFNAAYTTAAMTHAVKLGGFAHLIWSHTGGVYGPIRGGVKYATMQLIGDRGEQWAPFNALVGWRRTVGSKLLSTVQDLPPGVFSLSTKDPHTEKIGLVFANYGWAQRQAREVTVNVKNLADCPYRLRRYLVDQTHSSRWDVAEDRPEGSSQNDLQTVEDRTMNVSRTMSFSVGLPVWSSTFITLEPSGRC
jgi:hypothetical protein